MSMRCSIYYTIHDNMQKTICMLSEKCYLSGLKITILLQNYETQEALNKELWTYSRLLFLPHGSSNDSKPNVQPIYLTTNLENINNSSVLISKNSLNINDLITHEKLIKQFERICIICDNDNLEDKEIINNQVSVIHSLGYQIEYYTQNSSKQWQKI